MGENRAERIADKLVNLFSELRVDSGQIGKYFARIAPNKTYERFDEMVESAQREKTEREIQEGLEKNVHKFF
jgi:hypothetical protein